MAQATIIAAAGLGLSALGTITSAGAQAKQGEASMQAAKAQAAASQYQGEFNANLNEYRAGLSDLTVSLDEQAAERYLAEGDAQATIIARSTARVMGRTSAAYAASGVDMAGSPLDVLHDQATEGALQVSLAKYGGEVQAHDARVRGTFDAAQANIYRAIAASDRTMASFNASAGVASGTAIQSAAMGGAGATLLTGLGRAAMGGYNLATTANAGATYQPGVTPAAQAAWDNALANSGSPQIGPYS